MSEYGPLIEPIGVAEFFVDGFDNYEVKSGILSCSGYRIQHGTKERIAIVHIVMPVGSLRDAIVRATKSAAEGLAIDLARDLATVENPSKVFS